MFRTSLAVLASAVVMFIWGMLSWSVLGWHQPMDFSDGDAVAEVLKANCPDHGNYAYPSWNEGKGKSGGEMKAAQERMMQGLRSGPVIYATVRPGPRESLGMGAIMGTQFLIVVLASVALVFLIQKARHTAFLDRLSMAVLAGLLLGILSSLPAWNWMELPGRETVAYLLDGILQTTLAGAVIAVILPRKVPDAA